MKSTSKHGKVRVNVRLDHQVHFGEHVVILGSAKELGSWKKEVPLDWSESGWVGDLELKGGHSIEFKFVIVKDKSFLWEKGENRVIELPKQGSFGLVCHWNNTGEALDLLHLEEEDHIGENGSPTADAADLHLEVEPSPFVGQWQGMDISFVQSNEHRNRETDRKWDTSGLEGLALKLVEGDRSPRNWRRKVTVVDIFPSWFYYFF